MKNKDKPFTENEQKIMDLLVQAHNEFVNLPPMHPSEAQEWMLAFHSLQNILIYRCVKRDYPSYFK